ncbi:MAG: tetratricopeptide repeat-containing glycosyltransferase family protein [Burkholderiaceae bacterium]|nr:tetratricopeptide repeat-containing glycosyltransferase family protein [Burkholderiaceae bacterium]
MARYFTSKPNRIDDFHFMRHDQDATRFVDESRAQPPFSAMQRLVSLLNQGRLAEGETAAAEMTARFPQHGFGWKLLGVMQKLQHKHGPALHAMHRAAELLPADDEAQSNFGMALAEANELQAAEPFLRRAQAQNPHNAKTAGNLGNLLCRQGRLAEAEMCHRQALAIEPDNVIALCNLGSTQDDMGRESEAAACYERALQIAPHFAQAQWHASLHKLLAGDFTEGWKQYEWRWQTDAFAATVRRFTQAKWLGRESLQGKTILLHAEQGLGDTLQFCRYAKPVAERGATVVLQVPPALKSLLAGLAGVTQVIGDDEPAPPFDFHCPLLSLPLACGSSHADLPAGMPYLFAEPTTAAAWRTRLAETAAPRIGVAWSGNPLHRHDYKRSIGLADFATLFCDSAQFVCLQKELRESDAAALDAHPELLRFGAELQDFAQTAALIDTLDLVITVDTAVAHLAGAMGKPVWILLPFQPDWRWQKQRTDSPWYPSARLFRQAALGDWHSVVGAVRHALAQREYEAAI